MEQNKEIPICQSCAMPLNVDTNKGTNKDGSLSEEYCKYCFLNGEFTNPKLTLEEQINKLIAMSNGKMGLSLKQAKEMAEKVIPKLKRWKK